MGLLRTLRPEWWFSAHLHCRFEAAVVHASDNGVGGQQAGKGAEGTNPDEIAIEDDEFDKPEKVITEKTNEKETEATNNVSRNPDEILLEDEEEDVVAPPPPPPPPLQTKFLALDKCLPQRNFLEVRSHTSLLNC